MQTTLQAAGFTSDGDEPLLAQLPKWVQRQTCEIKHYPGAKRPCIKLSFECPSCDVVDRVQANEPKAGWSKGLAAQMLADAVVNKHGPCQSGADGESVPSDQQRVKSRLMQTKRKLCVANSKVQESALLLERHEGAANDARQHQRLQSTAAGRRLDIDYSNHTPLSDKAKSDAKVSKATGIIDTALYWARGSVAAIVQLIMVLITEFKVEDQVRAELCPELSLATSEEHITNHYVVWRLRLALDILKQPGSTEQQRIESRIIIAACAPELIEGDSPTDPRGMQAKVAKAIGVRRDRPPFRESVANRAVADKSSRLVDTPLKVGDAATCRHGTGVLTELQGGSCCVEITQDGQKFPQKFESIGKDGARLRRPHITFSPECRKQRKDATSEDVKQKVSTLVLLIYCCHFLHRQKDLQQRFTVELQEFTANCCCNFLYFCMNCCCNFL